MAFTNVQNIFFHRAHLMTASWRKYVVTLIYCKKHLEVILLSSLILYIFFRFFKWPGYYLLRILKAFDDFKNKPNSLWSNACWHVKVRVFWEGTQYNIHRDKTQKLKKISSNKKTGKKRPLFTLARSKFLQFYF